MIAGRMMAIRARALPLAIGAGAAISAFWLTHTAGPGSFANDAAARLAGRAILGAANQADPSTLLASYPSGSYVFLWLSEAIARTLTIDGVALASSLLIGGLLLAYAVTLRRAGFGWLAMTGLCALLCVHPFTILAISEGVQPLLVLVGVWLFGMGLFGFRAGAGINDLLALALSLPLLALTSVQGAAIAVAAIPFLLLAVPPQLAQRAYGSVYLVLLFPLVFSVLALAMMSWILLHDPLGFVPPGTFELWRATSRSWTIVAGQSVAAVFGTLVIAPILILRSRLRTPLQQAATALLGTIALATVLQAVFVGDGDVIRALIPVSAAGAVIAACWPMERGRSVRVAVLMLCGMTVAGGLVIAQAGSPAAALALATARTGSGPDGAQARLGRFLAGRNGVMIDAVAHPGVVAARGSADGLETTSSPGFLVALLERRPSADHVVVAAHRPGTSDDIISRTLPKLYASGAGGYRLTYDRDGWRVWSRVPAGVHDHV